MPTTHLQPLTDSLRMEDMCSASALLPLLDYDQQLAAIKELLHKHKRYEQHRNAEIAEIELHTLQSEMAIDDRAERMNAAVYQDAAHSMAAVGMLAPLAESIFFQAFLNIGSHYGNTTGDLPDHARWKLAAADQWNCHFYWDKGLRTENLVAGIMQLSNAVRLDPYLPQNIRTTLEALFGYRNKMFHLGFEWPVKDRDKFAKTILENGWVDWFSVAKMGGKPWIFYMTESFIFNCLEKIDSTVKAINKFERKL